MVKKKNYLFVDLFAGIGGMRIAFEREYSECILTCEIDKMALTTYQMNFKNSNNHSYSLDIRKLKSKDVPDHDILLAGFPCQPYSIAGLRKGLADERGKVFNDIIRIIRDKKPTVFLLENVRGIMAHDNGETFKYIIKRLENLGYYLKYQSLNTATHGNLPQNRERVFIVGFSDKNSYDKFLFPDKIKLNKKITQLLDTDNLDQKYYYDDRYDCYAKIKKVVKNSNSIYQWRRHYVRENKSELCPTLTANMGSGGHNVPLVYQNKKIRKLTPRECARFQGFPDSFKLPNISDIHLYHQFGNSVSIPLIKRIADNIYKSI
jgi:DNA (cytosine-5)-methyltransferase 1